MTVQDNIIDRDELQDNYINRILDGMDIKDMMAILYDQFDENLDKYSVDELIEEVTEYYPDLLEDWVTTMMYQVTDIEFDFVDSEGELPNDIQAEIVDDVLGIVWEADDDEDLVEEVTAATGFCVKSIDYRHVLK